MASLRSKIDHRASNQHIRWSLHRYVGRPRIVSTRIRQLPLDQSALYQVVVRIKSFQSLKKTIRDNGEKEHTAIVEHKGESKEIMEYVVMQKRIIRGDEEAWKLWGLAEETMPEDVLTKNSVGSPQVTAK